jgi:glucose/arabinose dehydrogenase/cytochrome c553
MAYTWSSFLLGTLAGVFVVALYQAITRRKLAPLTLCAAALVLAALVFFLAAGAGGGLIDLRLGVLLRGSDGRHAAGLHWPYTLLGAGLAICLCLAASWTTLDEKRPWRGQLPWVVIWGTLGIVIAIVLSERGRMNGLELSVSGLREIAAKPEAYVNRAMPLLVPVMTQSAFTVEPVVDGLEMPTSLVFMPDGDLLIGESAGSIKRLHKDSKTLTELAKLERVETRGETGLLALALHPDYPEQPYLYVYYVVENYASCRLLRFRFEDGKLTDPKEIFPPLPAAHFHNGGALLFGQDGMLYFTVGESNYRAVGEHYLYPEGTQGWSDYRGNIMRITPDGGIPTDNPFPGSPDYATGTREVFRMTVDPLTGRIFFAENGEASHDEINILVAGGNYGHPLALGLHGIPAFEEPVLDIVKPLGITGIAIYNGDQYPEQYKYDLFFGSWNTGSMYWVPLDRDPVRRLPKAPVVEIRFKDPTQGCYLDIRQGPDGLLYYSNQTGVFRLRLNEYVDPAQLKVAGHVTSIDGQDMFQRYCAACHQLDGRGRAGMFPPLAGSHSLVGDPQLPAAVALFGVQSEKNPQAAMPSFGAAFTDQQIAAAITYARSKWGNDASPVNAATVGSVRRAYSARVGQQTTDKRRALTVGEMSVLVTPGGH